MELTLLLIFLVALAGFIKGFVGFGLSLILITVLLNAGVEPTKLVPILVPLFVILDIMLWFENRHHAKLDFKENFPIHHTTLMSMFLGTLLGAYVLTIAQAEIIKLGFAVLVLLLIFLLLEKVSSTKPVIPSEKSNSVFGGVAGFLTGLFTLNAAVASIYLLYHQYSKEKYMGVLVTFLMFSNLVLVGVYLFLGLFTFEGFITSMQLIGIVLVGFFIGMYVRKHVPSSHFKAIVIFVLAINSVKIIFDYFFM